MTAAERKEKLARHAAELRQLVEQFITNAEQTTPVARMKMLEVSIAVQPKMEEMVKVATKKVKPG